MHMTVEEKAAALTGVLEHLGKLIQNANNDDPTIGAVTVTFDASGQFNLGFVGSLDKALTMGALADALLSFREIVNAKASDEQLLALAQSLTIPDSRKN